MIYSWQNLSLSGITFCPLNSFTFEMNPNILEPFCSKCKSLDAFLAAHRCVQQVDETYNNSNPFNKILIFGTFTQTWDVLLYEYRQPMKTNL